MAARTLVANDIEQGARLLRGLDAAGIPIEAAFWFLGADWSDWFLVLATPLYDELGSHAAYQRIFGVQRALDDIDDPYGAITVVSPDDRWVRAFRKQWTEGSPRPGYWRGGFFARDENMEILDSYVYRLVATAAESANGKASKHGAVPGRRASRNGVAASRPARTSSGA